ncbi:MAG: site-specific tyrosine recombinase/integron integrase [Desulfurococcaceae archaeon]
MPRGLDIGEAPEELLEADNETILQEFLAALEASGASEETLRAYRAALEDFLEFVKDKPLREVTSKDVLAWRAERLRNGFGRERGDRRGRQTTLHYYTLFVRRFLKWLGLDVRVPGLRRPPRKIEILSDEEIERLRSAAQEPEERLILDLLLDTGLRSRELLSLKVKDVDLKNRVLRVSEAKYGKERLVLMTARTAEELEWWIKIRGLGPEDRLFDLSYSGLYKMLKRLARRAGVDGAKVRPHVMRHTFATRALRAGMSLASLQRLMGHADIKTTQVYLHLSVEDLRAEYDSKMESLRRCPSCGRMVPKDALYCPYCGRPMAAEEAAKEAA